MRKVQVNDKPQLVHLAGQRKTDIKVTLTISRIIYFIFNLQTSKITANIDVTM